MQTHARPLLQQLEDGLITVLDCHCRRPLFFAFGAAFNLEALDSGEWPLTADLPVPPPSWVLHLPHGNHTNSQRPHHTLKPLANRDSGASYWSVTRRIVASAAAEKRCDRTQEASSSDTAAVALAGESTVGQSTPAKRSIGG